MTRWLAWALRGHAVALLAALAALAAATKAIAGPAASAPNAPPAASRAASAPNAAALGDPLESAECRRALSALNSEEAAVAEPARAGAGVSANERRRIDARLAPVRQQAARACLARRADPATLSSERLARPPPTAVTPLAVAPSSSPAAAPASAGTAPSPRNVAAPERPYSITSCDPGGCWANDGSRLNRVGPNLWGPRGICSVQGSLLQCP